MRYRSEVEACLEGRGSVGWGARVHGAGFSPLYCKLYKSRRSTIFLHWRDACVQSIWPQRHIITLFLFCSVRQSCSWSKGRGGGPSCPLNLEKVERTVFHHLKNPLWPLVYDLGQTRPREGKKLVGACASVFTLPRETLTISGGKCRQSKRQALNRCWDGHGPFGRISLFKVQCRR